MSRIGKLPIKIPSTVKIKLDKQTIEVSGPHGILSRTLSPLIIIEQKDDLIWIKKSENSRTAKELFGLSRTLVNNMVTGVSEKFEKQLIITGVGYRSQVKGNQLILNLGYSHPVIIETPTGVSITVQNNTIIKLQGIDKEVIGQLAATIRSKRPPEPYKGKGIAYQGEIIKRKVGKTGK